MKKKRYVNITAEVDVDVDLYDYIDELLEEASSEELTKELEKRGCTVINGTNPVSFLGEQVEFNNPSEFKRHLCDLINVGYYINNEELLKTIKIKLP